MPDPHIRIIVCTNDDHGNDTGRVSAIHFYEQDEFCEPLLELEHGFHGSELTMSYLPTLTYHGGQIVVAGKVYSLWSHHRSTHVGNIFWDSFRLEESVARQLATDLMRSGEWHDMVSTERWHWESKKGDWQDA